MRGAGQDRGLERAGPAAVGPCAGHAAGGRLPCMGHEFCISFALPVTHCPRVRYADIQHRRADPEVLNL